MPILIVAVSAVIAAVLSVACVHPGAALMTRILGRDRCLRATIERVSAVGEPGPRGGVRSDRWCRAISGGDAELRNAPASRDADFPEISACH